MELKGKKVSFLGDSITEGWGTSDPEYRYDRVLCRRAGLSKTYNYGIGGTCFSYHSGSRPSDNPKYDLYFCGRAALMDPDTDLIVVFGGTNDYGHGKDPFGDEFSETRLDTYCGAVNYVMSVIPEAYPGVPFVFMTPMKRYCGEIKNAVGKRLSDYVDYMISAADARGVPVLDLYHDLGIDPDKPEDFEKYTIDGLHPNDAGHAVIADKLYEFLITL